MKQKALTFLFLVLFAACSKHRCDITFTTHADSTRVDTTGHIKNAVVMNGFWQ